MESFELQVLDFLCRRCQVVSHGRLKAEDLVPSDRVIQDLQLDSLDYAEIYFATVEEFNIQVEEPQDWSQVQTLGQIASHLCAKA